MQEAIKENKYRMRKQFELQQKAIKKQQKKERTSNGRSDS